MKNFFHNSLGFIALFVFAFGISAQASTITTMAGTDTLSSSRTTINTNFSNLNTDKLEATVANIFTALQRFNANASTTALTVSGETWLQNASSTQLTVSDKSWLGTIVSGLWNGTVIGASYGGAGTVSGILKANGSGTVSAASSGTDYAPATSGSAILKGNGSGGFSSASNGTDYTLVSASSCSNQAITALTASGGSTCSSITSSFLSGAVAIAHGGTATTTGGNTNGVEYYDGSKITNSATFTFNGSEVATASTRPATSTAMQLDWSATPNQVEYRIGNAATTINIINATTSAFWGSRKVVWVCNPNDTAGAITWKPVEWIGTAPAQTTTANNCDVYSFDITAATSTTAYKVAGTAGTNFQ